MCAYLRFSDLRHSNDCRGSATGGQGPQTKKLSLLKAGPFLASPIPYTFTPPSLTPFDIRLLNLNLHLPHSFTNFVWKSPALLKWPSLKTSSPACGLGLRVSGSGLKQTTSTPPNPARDAANSDSLSKGMSTCFLVQGSGFRVTG